MTDRSYPRIVAHRGGGKLAPENTLEALSVGAESGHRMVEFDAKLAADEAVFLLHDDLLDRTSNGRGPAKALAYAEIAALDAGAWFDTRFTGARMPTLEQAAQRCQALGLAANVEIKPCEGRDGITGERVAQAVARCWRDASGLPPLLSSFSFEALSRAAHAAPDLPRGMLYETVPADWLQQARTLECFSLHAHYKQFDQRLVGEIKAAGLQILAYTVNDPEIARDLLRWGVDMICTDRIDLIGPDFAASLR